MDNMFVDYWTCDKCKSEHYGMCYQCGKCGRIFQNGQCINLDKYPCSEEE